MITDFPISVSVRRWRRGPDGPAGRQLPSTACANPAGIAPGGATISRALLPGRPAGYALPTVKNCADLAVGPPDNTIPVNDHDCAIGSVPFPDLAPGGATECKRGESCTIDARIDNKGRLPFHGAAGLHGTLTPAVKILSIKTSTPGFACNVTGNGVYDCKGANLDLAPGSSMPIDIVIDIPADLKPKPSPTPRKWSGPIVRSRTRTRKMTSRRAPSPFLDRSSPRHRPAPAGRSRTGSASVRKA